MKNKYLAILSLLFVISCQKQQFSFSKNGMKEMPTNPTYQEWDNQFLWGLVPTSKHDAYQICGGDVEIVGTKMSFWQGVLNGVTYGLYSPRTYQIQCTKK